MLEKLTDIPDGIDGLKAVGKVSKEDYENMMTPLLEAARRVGSRVRLLYQLGPEFDGFTMGAAWEDAKVGLHYMRQFDGCAIVTDLGWVHGTTKIARFMLPCPVRIFGNQERNQAIGWLSALPQDAAIVHQLLPNIGVIVIEVKHEALRAQDFEAVSLTANTWIEAHGSLQGIVIHARAFPGWENLGSFMRHVRFVRDHHRKVKRIALAVGSKLASLAPRLAEHFVKAEVKSFGYDRLDAAVAWAGDRVGVESVSRTLDATP